MYAAGQVVGTSGRLNYTVHRNVDDTTGATFCPNGSGITDARVAAIHAVVRTHGDKIPGLVDDQIHTFFGACETNVCANVQASAHEDVP